MATDLRGLSLRNRINLREYSYMKDQAKPTLECHRYTDEFRDLGKTVDNIGILGRYKNQIRELFRYRHRKESTKLSEYILSENYQTSRSLKDIRKIQYLKENKL